MKGGLLIDSDVPFKALDWACLALFVTWERLWIIGGLTCGALLSYLSECIYIWKRVTGKVTNLILVKQKSYFKKSVRHYYGGTKACRFRCLGFCGSCYAWFLFVPDIFQIHESDFNHVKKALAPRVMLLFQGVKWPCPLFSCLVSATKVMCNYFTHSVKSCEDSLHEDAREDARSSYS